MKDYKVKVLIKKFDFNELVAECERQGWELPSATQVSNMNIPYDRVWVTDPPIREEDKVSHAYSFSKVSGSLLIINRNNLEYAVVMIPINEED